MIFPLFFAFFGIIFLIFFHELGHFFFAKIFKVKVEEFGIFFPPRIFAKKIGQTLFSINLLPFGAFVKLFGEREIKKEKGSFSQLPILKRILIVLGGAISFWIVSIFFLIFILNSGISTPIPDEKFFPDSKVQILQVFPNSPAAFKLLPGDEILKINGKKIEKAKEVQEIINQNLGKEILLEIKRGEKILKMNLVPRVSPPKGQGPLGISISKVKVEKYSFFQALFKAPILVFNLTFLILKSYFLALQNLILGKAPGVSLMGPVGISYLLWQVGQAGFFYYLNFLALISINLAIFNLLPIPALDGGKILFLVIEGIRKKPISKEIEEKITIFFILIFLLLIFFATISDIKMIF